MFASGLRNSYGIILHSNGYLYATDNGANVGYGMCSLSCTEKGPSPNDVDELNVVIEGNFYGHPNRKRGERDPRQCRYRSTNETASDDEYTGPISWLHPSSNGLCEFETEHFAGQLRRQLIISRWKGEIYNAKLSNDGLSTETGPSDYPPKLIEEGALDIVQGPDGALFTAKHSGSAIKFYAPVEEQSSGLKVKSVFPRRGSSNGGSSLTIYGDHLYTFGFPSVNVGGNTCTVHSPTSNTKITCTLPGGSGTADVIVTSGLQTDMLREGYRFIINAEATSRIDLDPTPSPIPMQSPPPTHSPHQSTPAPTPLPTQGEPFATTIIESLGIQAFVWVNTTTNEAIGPVTAVCDACFNLSDPVTIRADTWGEVNSVEMSLEGELDFGPTFENSMPWALFGDKRWDYKGRVFEKGVYTVKAQAFSRPEGEGLAGEAVSLDFEIL